MLTSRSAKVAFGGYWDIAIVVSTFNELISRERRTGRQAR